MKKPTKDPMVTALQGKLQGILAKPMTAKTLLELERTARLARELLMVGTVVLPTGISTSMIDLPLAPSPIAETFGSAAIRELVIAAKDMMKPPPSYEPKTIEPFHIEPSLMDRVMAITHAKEHGLHDLAARLEAELPKAVINKEAS